MDWNCGSASFSPKSAVSSGNPISALESNDSADEVTGTTKANKAIQLPALYEKMLRTAATAPERFKEIEYLIKSVSADGVIPEGFEELYNTFRKVVKM